MKEDIHPDIFRPFFNQLAGGGFFKLVMISLVMISFEQEDVSRSVCHTQHRPQADSLRAYLRGLMPEDSDERERLPEAS